MGHVVVAVASQSVSAELDELTRHNQAVLRTRGTRVSLAELGVRLPRVDGGNRLVNQRLMTEYWRRRVQDDAAALVWEATRQLDRRDATRQPDRRDATSGQPEMQWDSGMPGQFQQAAEHGLQ